MKTKILILLSLLSFQLIVSAQLPYFKRLVIKNSISVTSLVDEPGEPYYIEAIIRTTNNPVGMDLNYSNAYASSPNLPNDFSMDSSQPFTLTNGSENREGIMSIKRVLPITTFPFSLAFNGNFTPGSWNVETNGWAAIGYDEQVTDGLSFIRERGMLVIYPNAAQGFKQLSFDISYNGSQPFAGSFSVDINSTANASNTQWYTLKLWNKKKEMLTNETLSFEIPEDTRFIRFIYNGVEKGQQVKINNVYLGN